MKIGMLSADVRFERSFLFDDGRTKNEIMKFMKSEFPVNGSDNANNALVFLDPISKTNCQLFSDKIIITVDEPADMNKIKAVGSKIIPFIMGRLEVLETQRVGVRGHFVKNEISGEKDAELYIIEQFYSQDLINLVTGHSRLTSISPRAAFQLTINHEMFMGVQIGLHQIGNGTVNPDGTVTLLNIQSVYPLADFDVYTTVGKKPDQINGLLRGMCDHLSTYSYSIWK